MWIVLAFISALCLGGYDISKKISLRDNRVIDILTLSVVISSAILLVPLIMSRCCAEWMMTTPFYVPQMSLRAHMLTVLKSAIVLSSWVFAYISLKHLPISIVSPMQATRPMWTLVGALLIFGERLNAWQWAGVALAIGSIFIFSLSQRHEIHISTDRKNKQNIYYLCLILAILIGSCSGLYDKYLMRHYDHNAVQVYYTIYQAIMMLIVWAIAERKEAKVVAAERIARIHWTPAIVLISVFLVMSDNAYMLSLSDPDSLIAVVSTIRRGGAVIGFAYGLLFLHEPQAWKKILCMTGIIIGLICLAMGSA